MASPASPPFVWAAKGFRLRAFTRFHGIFSQFWSTKLLSGPTDPLRHHSHSRTAHTHVWTTDNSNKPRFHYFLNGTARILLSLLLDRASGLFRAPPWRATTFRTCVPAIRRRVSTCKACFFLPLSSSFFAFKDSLSAAADLRHLLSSFSSFSPRSSPFLLFSPLPGTVIFNILCCSLSLSPHSRQLLLLGPGGFSSLVSSRSCSSTHNRVSPLPPSPCFLANPPGHRPPPLPGSSLPFTLSLRFLPPSRVIPLLRVCCLPLLPGSSIPLSHTHFHSLRVHFLLPPSPSAPTHHRVPVHRLGC